MWDVRYLSRIDFRLLPLLLALMLISLLIISSHTSGELNIFVSPLVQAQLKWFLVGWGVFFFFSGIDYNKIREWTWAYYLLLLFLLIGVFFTPSIQSVNRWYKIPFLNISFQPSEPAKLAVVFALSWFLERQKLDAWRWTTVVFAFLIVGIPFILILKQPDLGSALVLFPISLVIFYFGNLRPSVVKGMIWMAAVAVSLIALIFLGTISHESLRPYATKVLKNYQFDRLNPQTHHQKAATTAIALGGLSGTGWRKSEFTGGGWLPTPDTDSVFPAFGEEFGFFGLSFLLLLFYALIHCCFQVTAVAKDDFGRLLSAGITVYLAVHIIVNIGMMCGILPITGVPLVLISYGGTSILATMASLGILQSIYSRRFMF